MSWHLASISSSGSSPFARTATHSSIGSSVEARWSARFGDLRCVGGVGQRHAVEETSRRRRVDGVADDARSAIRYVPSRGRRVDGVRDVELCLWRCSAGESQQKSSQTLICALRFYQAVSGHLKALGFLQR